MLSEPDETQRLLQEMRHMDDLQRKIVFDRLKEQYCDDCGRAIRASYCHCTNDE